MVEQMELAFFVFHCLSSRPQYQHMGTIGGAMIQKL
jgi:hypothetical protein